MKNEIPLKKLSFLLTACLPIASLQAQTNLVANGGFEDHSIIAGAYSGRTVIYTPKSWSLLRGNSQLGTISAVATDGYIDLASSFLWNNANGGTYTGSLRSPSNDSFYFLGGDYPYGGTLYQTITNLTVGNQYTVTFDWAAGQQVNYDGPTTQQWQVGVGDSVLTPSNGSSTFSTAVVTTPEHGFTPWQSESFSFTAKSTKSVLSFLAKGTPEGQTPIVLLDNVTLVQVPEPSSALLLGLSSLSVFIRRRK